MSARARQYRDALDAVQAAYGAIRDAQNEHWHGTASDASERAHFAAWDRARSACNRLTTALAEPLKRPADNLTTRTARPGEGA